MSEPNWHKSSYSGTSSDNCVEVAANTPGAVLVRDTKDHGMGALTASPEAWSAFIGNAKAQRP